MTAEEREAIWEAVEILMELQADALDSADVPQLDFTSAYPGKEGNEVSIQSYVLYRDMLNHVTPDTVPGVSYWVCQMRDLRYGTIWAYCDTTEQLYDVVDHLIQGAGEPGALRDFVIKMFADDEEVSGATLLRWADDHDIRKLSFYDRLKRDQERRKREQRN